MEYFSKFPIIAYDMSTDKEKISYLVRDITRNVRFRKKILAEITLYDEYDILDGETPEVISNKIYGSPFYHWIVMLANETYDWVRDYPMTQTELEDYIQEKYGSLAHAHQLTKHYLNDAGEVIFFDATKTNFQYTDPISGLNEKLNYQNKSGEVIKRVSCYDYEEQINESKRRIKIISPELLTKILTNFRESI